MRRAGRQLVFAGLFSLACFRQLVFALGLHGCRDYKRRQIKWVLDVNAGNWKELMADARRAPLKDQTDISGARALIVEARFYDDIQDALLEGALAELKAAGVSHDIITVPGALEIPAAIAIALDAAATNGKPYDAAVALGCVIRGDTIHFEIV